MITSNCLSFVALKYDDEGASSTVSDIIVRFTGDIDIGTVSSISLGQFSTQLDGLILNISRSTNLLTIEIIGSSTYNFRPFAAHAIVGGPTPTSNHSFTTTFDSGVITFEQSFTPLTASTVDVYGQISFMFTQL